MAVLLMIQFCLTNIPTPCSVGNLKSYLLCLFGVAVFMVACWMIGVAVGRMNFEMRRNFKGDESDTKNKGEK